MSGSNAPREAGPRGHESGRRRSSRRRTTVDPADLLDRAITQRDDWLSWALCTLPADRPAAEAAITELYRSVGGDEPQFVWVESPRAGVSAAAAEGLAGEPFRLRAASAPDRGADWPLGARLATQAYALRNRMEQRVRRSAPRLMTWPPHPALRTVRNVPPRESLREGLTLEEVLRVTVTETLHASVHESLGGPLRGALAAEIGTEIGTESGAATGAIPVLTWYGQHDAHWVADHCIRRDLSLTRGGRGPGGGRAGGGHGGVGHGGMRGGGMRGGDGAELDLWAAVSRSCGWWWPYDRVCVVSERPVTVHTEPVPGAMHGELRLHSGKGQAVRYADGWGAYSWHGTLVPSWVITDPSVDRIAAEPNTEVRRCAIERIGWDVYIDRAGLSLVSTAADPGNPGCELRLYDMPTRLWGAPVRVLLAVNGSVERDGRRRRYGLSVPADMDDPVAAAGWSYGLTGEQYARLLRRT